MSQDQSLESNDGQEVNGEFRELDTESCLASGDEVINSLALSVAQQKSGDGEEPREDLDESGQGSLFGSGNEPSMAALIRAWHSLPTGEQTPEALWEAIDGDQVLWGTITIDGVIQPPPTPESLYQQMLDLSERPQLRNTVLGDVLALSKSEFNFTSRVSAALVAQSESVLAEFTRSILIPELNSLSSSAAQRLASYVDSSFADVSRSLVSMALEAVPKINFSDLLPKYDVSQIVSSLAVNTNLSEITRPLLESIHAEMHLDTTVAERLRSYLEPQIQMRQFDLLEVVSSSLDRKLRANYLDLIEPIRTTHLERYYEEQQWLDIALHREIRTGTQLSAGEHEILARLERLESYILHSVPPSTSPDLLPKNPPIPGQDGTWDDVFDWFYRAPRILCEDLKDLARKIGMAYGTVKKEHSLYKSSNKRLPLQ